MLSKQQALTLLVLGTLLLYLGYSYYNTTPDSYKAVYHNIVFKNLNRITSQRIQNLFYKKAETAEIPIVLHTIGPNVGKTTNNTVFSSTTSSTLMFTETSKTIDKVKSQTNSANNNFFHLLHQVLQYPQRLVKPYSKWKIRQTLPIMI